MAAPLRVLVVDDSVVFRKVVSSVVESDSSLQLVGTAANGSICMQKVQQLNPDVITLDLEMPEMDGFAVLRELQKAYRHIRVVVFSLHTERGAAQTFEAMRLGAADFLSKGLCLGGRENSIQYIKDQLIPKILQFARVDRPFGGNASFRNGASTSGDSLRSVSSLPPPRPSVLSRPPISAQASNSPLGVRNSVLSKPPDSVRTLPPAPNSRRQTVSWPPTRNVPREIIAVGVSTGGPNALGRFLPMLSKSFPVPIVIVQHMPPLFTRLLAERLDSSCEITVKEAAEGMRIEPGTAYIAPGDRHLVLKRSGTQIIASLSQGLPENSCRPAVDVLFRSVADIFGAAAVAVMLTGMGKDGFAGTQQFKKQGAFVIAQDKATSVVWGMPGFVVEAGLANVVVPIDHVATEVERCLLQSTVHRI